ncbi:hypothetical protein ACSBR2_032465 [Camellia fascicularis]
MPECVAKEIAKIQSRFLWGGDELRRKIHLVSWDEISKSKSKRGLGFKRIRLMNDCLLLKWWWRFGSENDTLWKQVISSKYSETRRRWWPLPMVFPRLYSLFMDKAVSVKLVLSRRNGTEDGNFKFRRFLFQWEEEELRSLNEMLLNAPAIRE